MSENSIEYQTYVCSSCCFFCTTINIFASLRTFHLQNCFSIQIAHRSLSFSPLDCHSVLLLSFHAYSLNHQVLEFQSKMMVLLGVIEFSFVRLHPFLSSSRNPISSDREKNTERIFSMEHKDDCVVVFCGTVYFCASIYE